MCLRSAPAPFSPSPSRACCSSCARRLACAFSHCLSSTHTSCRSSSRYDCHRSPPTTCSPQRQKECGAGEMRTQTPSLLCAAQTWSESWWMPETNISPAATPTFAPWLIPPTNISPAATLAFAPCGDARCEQKRTTGMSCCTRQSCEQEHAIASGTEGRPCPWRP
eukprot:579940-Rhodomonas_salina.1